MIDWKWVKRELFCREGIARGKNANIAACAQICLNAALLLSDPRIISSRIPKPSGLSRGKLSKYVKGAIFFQGFIVTIGKGVEARASALMSKGMYLEGYMFDRIGSFAVESLIQNFEDRLRKRYAKRSLSVSRRISPGYCDWPIDGQFELSKMLSFSKAGVRLTKSCMMIPRKSISAVVGVGPKNAFRSSKHQCSICEKKDCDYRRGPILTDTKLV